MSKETYQLGLSVYRQGRGKHRWAVGHAEGTIASGDEGTHEKAREVGMAALIDFCHKEGSVHHWPDTLRN